MNIYTQNQYIILSIKKGHNNFNNTASPVYHSAPLVIVALISYNIILQYC